MAHEKTEADIVHEYGPFPSVETVAGVTFDGENVWFSGNGRLRSVEAKTGTLRRVFEVPADAGTAFDGRHLFQLAGECIHKIDPQTGDILGTVPAPASGTHSGLAWVEGKLWVGHRSSKRLFQIDPDTGRILHTLETSRAVTGVTFVDGDLWHGTWEDDQSDLRRVDPDTGEVLEAIVMPKGMIVAGLESDGRDLFYSGGGRSGKVRAIRRPKRG